MNLPPEFDDDEDNAAHGLVIAILVSLGFYGIIFLIILFR